MTEHYNDIPGTLPNWYRENREARKIRGEGSDSGTGDEEVAPVTAVGVWSKV